MLFLLILIAVFILSIFLLFYYQYDNDYIFFPSIIVCFICIIFLISIPIARLKDKLLIEEIKSFELTVKNCRENENILVIERAAILKQITDINRKLSKAKYLNKTFIGDIFVVDELCKLEYIE